MLSRFAFILGLLLFFSPKCWCNEKTKVGYDSLLTRYISVLNAISKPDAPPKNEVRRELLLSLLINYFYLRSADVKLSENFKGIVKSIGKKVEDFNFDLELESYRNMINVMDADSAVFRITLDGFDEKTARFLLDKFKANDFDDLKKWVAK